MAAKKKKSEQVRFLLITPNDEPELIVGANHHLAVTALGKAVNLVLVEDPHSSESDFEVYEIKARFNVILRQESAFDEITPAK